MRRNKKYGFGSVVTQAGALVPDPVTKGILMASGLGISAIESILKSQKLNSSYNMRNTGYRQMGGGGTVSALVEKGEVVKPADGDTPYEVKGGTHEEGKDTVISEPAGTEVYSEDLAIKGKSMAEYEKARMRKEKRLSNRLKKLSEKSDESVISAPISNMVDREANNILAELVQIQSERDAHMAIQEAADQNIPVMGKGGRMKKYGFGTDGIDPKASTELLASLNNKTLDPEIEDSTAQSKTNEAKKSNISAKKVYGYADLGATILNLLNNPEEPNYYEGYGDRALQNNTLQMDVAAANRDFQLGKSRLSRNSALQSIRNSARGSGQYLANVTATDVAFDENNQGVANTYSNVINTLLSQRTGLLNDQDRALAESRTRLFDSKERRWDAITSNLAKGVKNAALSHGDGDIGVKGNKLGNTQNNEILSLLMNLLQNS